MKTLAAKIPSPAGVMEEHGRQRGRHARLILLSAEHEEVRKERSKLEINKCGRAAACVSGLTESQAFAGRPEAMCERLGGKRRAEALRGATAFPH